MDVEEQMRGVRAYVDQLIDAHEDELDELRRELRELQDRNTKLEQASATFSMNADWWRREATFQLGRVHALEERQKLAQFMDEVGNAIRSGRVQVGGPDE